MWTCVSSRVASSNSGTDAIRCISRQDCWWFPYPVCYHASKRWGRPMQRAVLKWRHFTQLWQLEKGFDQFKTTLGENLASVLAASQLGTAAATLLSVVVASSLTARSHRVQRCSFTRVVAQITCAMRPAIISPVGARDVPFVPARSTILGKRDTDFSVKVCDHVIHLPP